MVEYPADSRIVFHCFHIAAHGIVSDDEQLGETVYIVAWCICLYRLFTKILGVNTRLLCHHAYFVRFAVMYFRGGFHQSEYFRFERVERNGFRPFVFDLDPFSKDRGTVIQFVDDAYSQLFTFPGRCCRCLVIECDPFSRSRPGIYIRDPLRVGFPGKRSLLSLIW